MIQSVKLSKLCKMQSGGTPSRAKLEYYEGDFPWAKISDLEKSDDGYIYKTEEHITPEALSSINNRQFKPGTLLLAMYGSVGKTAITKIDLTTNQAILGINILDNKILDIKYLKYWFSTIKERLLNRAVGAALPNISLGIVKDLEIPLPLLEQQKKIANILDAADELRQNDKALIAKYDELTRVLLLDMFGDPVGNPKGWNKVELKQFGKISTGNTPSRADEKNYSSRFIEWIKTDNIKENSLYISEASEYLSDIGIKKARTVEKDAVLVACIAGSIDSIGRAALTNRKVSFNQQINAIESNSKVNPKYLYYLIRNCKKHIQNHASNGMKRMLTKGEFEKILMILPPLILQNQFAERVAIIEEQKAIAQKSLEKSEELFNSLLQKAFKGELV